MPTLTYPTLSILPTTLTWSLVPKTQTFQSPLTGTEQTKEIPGAVWAASLTYELLQETDARLLKRFFAQLRGAAGRFFLYDMTRPIPASNQGTGTPLVVGANQVGATLNIDGCTANRTPWMAADYYFSVNNELKLLTTNSNSSGTGTATLAFEPPLRSSPPDNSAITVTNPTCIMRLVDDGQDNFAWRGNLLTSVSFSCIESF